MATFRKARPADAEALALASKKAFDYDVHYGAPGPGGPPGYDSALWQKGAMRWGHYYKILSGDRIVGGIIVIDKRSGHYELGRIFIEPDFQNQGIGTEAIAFIEKEFRFGHRWTLGTPVWALRNQHFYEKVGYLRLGLDAEGDGVLYEKRIRL